MNLTSELEMAEFASTLIHTRRNISPRRLVAPGPSALQLQDILGAASAAPDHGRLQPWRFIIVPANQRERLADVFGLALLDRDPNASGFQIERAREKAHRAPFLMLAVARLVEPVTPVKPLPDRKRSINCTLSLRGEIWDAGVHVNKVDTCDGEQLRSIERSGGEAHP